VIIRLPPNGPIPSYHLPRGGNNDQPGGLTIVTVLAFIVIGPVMIYLVNAVPQLTLSVPAHMGMQ